MRRTIASVCRAHRAGHVVRDEPPGGGGVGGSSSSGETPTVQASLTLKLYRFGLSTSPACENMTIYEIENPGRQNTASV